MKKINSRSGILPGAIIMVALFFIFDKLFGKKNAKGKLGKRPGKSQRDSQAD